MHTFYCTFIEKNGILSPYSECKKEVVRRQGMGYLLFLQLTFGVAILSLLIGLWKQSAWFMIISTLLVIPTAYHFTDAANFYRLIALLPIIFMIIAFAFWRKKNNAKSQ